MYTYWYCREPLSANAEGLHSAREANRLLESKGQPFWQAESYDHSVRDEKQAARIKAYLENNPVKAGWLRTRRTIGGPVPKPRRISELLISWNLG
jgi:hypothetical protein